ncbi:MAG: hypothetical protein Q9227_003429 [Pyrenula ochraceoflavens]
MECTPYGMRVHPTEPVSYDDGNLFLKELREAIGLSFPFDWYTFRRWTGNEANRSHIFEKYYNDDLIPQDVQSVVLLRPPQIELLREAAQMHRKGDPDAPQDLTDDQRRTLCGDPYLTGLRRERAALHRQMRFGGKSISSATDTNIHQRYSELGKAINRRRQKLRRKGKA